MTFGKVMGGGFPAAAFGGRADLMQHLAPVGGVYQAGTLSGNPVATAAGLTALAAGDARVYAHVDRAAERAAGRGRRGADRGRCAARHPAQRELVQRVLRGRGRDRRAGLRRRINPADRPVRRVLPCHARRGRLSAAQRVRGLVPCAAHDDRALERIVPALPAAAAAAAQASGGQHGRATDDRAPGPARRGRQPRRPALRPAARLPPVRARSGDGPAGRRGPARRATSCTCAARRWSGRRRPWSRSPRRSACR